MVSSWHQGDAPQYIPSQIMAALDDLASQIGSSSGGNTALSTQVGDVLNRMDVVEKKVAKLEGGAAPAPTPAPTPTPTPAPTPGPVTKASVKAHKK